MADYINKIRTTEGDRPVNYEALANKPSSLPNPNKIKFTGSVVAEYDGSSEVTVNIPNGASEEQAAQIQTNTNDISELKNKTSELKGDITHSKEAIKDLSDKKITKFYASNLGETTLNDSDNGKIQDMILYGKSLQDGTPTPESPVEIQSVVNPVVKVYDADGTHTKTASLPYTLNAIPVSSDGNVTIDGQEYIADYVDVERGKLVRMVDKHDLGAVDWNMDVYDGNYYFYSVTSGFKSKQGYFDCLCSQYRYVPYHSVKYNDMSLAVQNNNVNQYIVLKNDIYTDASSLKSSLNGVYVYFILETPTEIDLTDEEVQAFRDLATYYPTTNVFVTSDQLDGYTEFNYPVSLAEGWNYVKQQLGDTRDYIYDMDLQYAEAYVNSEYAVALAELEV